jgi:Uma2 family endonuclease
MLMALPTRAWTLAELDRLPDDGNKYELVDGALFVTPAPSPAHEQLVSVLLAILVPYVQTQQLGRVHTPRAVVRTDDSEVEPDLMVRPASLSLPTTWAEMPTPLLVVEVLSHTTHRRDEQQKRAFYQRISVAEYWMVDRWSRTIRVVRRDGADRVEDSVLEWQPVGASKAMRMDVAVYFDEALGRREVR